MNDQNRYFDIGRCYLIYTLTIFKIYMNEVKKMGRWLIQKFFSTLLQTAHPDWLDVICIFFVPHLRPCDFRESRFFLPGGGGGGGGPPEMHG